MWTVWIISTVIGLDEPRLTRYATFDDKASFYHSWITVTSGLTENEVAVCEQTMIEK